MASLVLKKKKKTGPAPTYQNRHPIGKLMYEEGLSIPMFITKYKIPLSTSFISAVVNGRKYLSATTATIIAKATGLDKRDLIFPY